VAGGESAEDKTPAGRRTALPVAERRGISKHLSDGWSHFLIHAPGGTDEADALLDSMLNAGWIGAARRDIGMELIAGNVPRPMGAWGLLVQLAGLPWIYVLGDGLRYEWVKELASKLGRRTAFFELSGLHGTLYGRAYEGDETLADFECGAFIQPDDGRELVRLSKEALDATARGALVDTDWLRQFRTGPEAQDALARRLELYLPVLVHTSRNGKADLFGRDASAFKKADYARIDLFVLGDSSTLEPGPANRALANALHAGDAAGVRAALEQGADVRYLPETDQTPLDLALSLGQGGTYDWRYKRISREQQLEVMAALLEAGVSPDPKGDEPAIHRVLNLGDKGDERTVIRQLRLLLDHGADPNSFGTQLRTNQQRPLHVVAIHFGWMAVMKELIARGADPKAPNGQGKTPREAAQAKLDYVVSTSGGGGGISALLGAAASVVRGLTNAGEDEAARVRRTIDFLAAAERGEADLSGVDELAEASWKAWSAEHEKWKARRKAENPDLWRELHGEDA
jgi:hypothetical protein